MAPSAKVERVSVALSWRLAERQDRTPARKELGVGRALAFLSGRRTLYFPDDMRGKGVRGGGDRA